MKSGVPSGEKFTLLFLVLLAIGLAVSYGNSFGIGFYFDDTYGIANNPAIRSLRNIPSFFIDPQAVWIDHSQVDLRPVLLITYAVNYAISGLEPWSYHALNLLLHLIASVLVFFIVRDHLWQPREDAHLPAAAAALFFALAPLNSQPVNYIWARSALLCVTLYLGAFLAYVRGRRLLASVVFALALLTKAIAVTLPAMLLVHDFVYRDRSRYPNVKSYAKEWRRIALPLLLPAILCVVYIVYRNAVLPPWTAQARQEAWVTPWIWFISQWPALIYYVRLFLWPDAISVDHAFPYSVSLLAPRGWGSLLLLLLWAGLALVSLRRHPQVTFATAWFFVTLAPESSFVPLAEVVNDHRPYIASSLGLSVLLAWALYQITKLSGARQRAAFVTLALFICIAALPVNRHRTWQWQDPLRLWEDTVAKSPNNTRAWMNAGLVYMNRGEMNSARRYFERAKELAPGYAYVHMNLSVFEAHQGRLDEALAAAEEAVRLRPDLAKSYFYRGKVLAKVQRTEEAISDYQHAIRLNPRDGAIQTELARLVRSDGASEEAIQRGMMKVGLDLLYAKQNPGAAAAQFQRLLARNPSHYGATFQLARAFDRAGKSKDARLLWEKMLKMAEAANDRETLITVRGRLHKLP